MLTEREPVKVRAGLRRLRNEVRVATTTGTALNRLGASEHPKSEALAAAIGLAVHAAPDDDARNWINRIDALRDGLLACKVPLDPEGLDGGASNKLIGEAAMGTTHRDWGTLQLLMVRALDPASCLELGASLGISGAYIAAGMRLAAASNSERSEGRLVSYEASLARARHAVRTWETLDLANAEVIADRFEPDDARLPEIAPIDFAFLDAHHEPAATLAFTDAVLAHLSPTGVLLFDDIRWSPGMETAWHELRANDRVAASVDLGRVGICMYRTRSDSASVHVSVASRLSGSMISAT